MWERRILRKLNAREGGPLEDRFLKGSHNHGKTKEETLAANGLWEEVENQKETEQRVDRPAPKTYFFAPSR